MRHIHLHLVCAGLVGLLCTGTTRAGMATLTPSLDTSLYDSPNPLANPISNGAGEFLFAGTTGPNNNRETRRALLRFDVASMVPANAIVELATLQLVVTRSPLGAGTDSFALHRSLAAWGEGTSDPTGNEGQGTAATPGDATWLHRRFPGEFWTTPGGEFATDASATAAIGTQGLPYLVTGTGLAADIQQWINHPAENFGWFLLGDEAGSQTVRQFGSRESPDQDSRPTLHISYHVIPEPSVPALLLLGATVLIACVTRRRRGSPAGGRFLGPLHTLCAGPDTHPAQAYDPRSDRRIPASAGRATAPRAP